MTITRTSGSMLCPARRKARLRAGASRNWCQSCPDRPPLAERNAGAKLGRLGPHAPGQNLLQVRAPRGLQQAIDKAVHLARRELVGTAQVGNVTLTGLAGLGVPVRFNELKVEMAFRACGFRYTPLL
jgi:hypothetical protein